MLAQQVVEEYGERAEFAVQDFGASPLADRFGVDKYPAIFVDDVLVAIPQDFYAWGGAGNGRYIPWTEESNRRKFQADLRKMIDVRLTGGHLASSAPLPSSDGLGKPLPSVRMTALDGREIALEDMRGKPLLIEFWAPWCPPCLQTMRWFRDLKPGEIEVVAIAVESKREDVDRVVAEIQPRATIVMGNAQITEAFGGVPAVPTLFLADAAGNVARVFYGAPPDLHEQIEAAVAKLEEEAVDSVAPAS